MERAPNSHTPGQTNSREQRATRQNSSEFWDDLMIFFELKSCLIHDDVYNKGCFKWIGGEWQRTSSINLAKTTDVRATRDKKLKVDLESTWFHVSFQKQPCARRDLQNKTHTFEFVGTMGQPLRCVTWNIVNLENSIISEISIRIAISYLDFF